MLREKRVDNKSVTISFFSNKDYLAESRPNNPDARIYQIHEFDKEVADEVIVLKILEKHAQNYGTIDELVLAGDGTKCTIAGSGYSISIIDMLGFIEQSEQQLNIKVANRIVFDACNTFSRLSDGDIRILSNYAKEHDVELVGSVSYVSSIAFGSQFGRFVVFKPNGQIIWDPKRDCPNNPFTWFGTDKSWVDSYINHSVEEGAADRKVKEIKEFNEQKEAIQRQQRINKCSDFGPKY